MMNKEELGRMFPIEVVEYDPNWVILYEEEDKFLRSQFSADVLVRTEHIGSTAVPGLAAKPTIDILVKITSFEKAKQIIVPRLTNIEGYSYYWTSSQSDGHMMFPKGYFPEAKQKYHLHMAPANHSIWDRIYFRDYLRTHPETAKLYANLKYKLAEIHKYDRDAYTEAKTDFIIKITQLAKEESE